MALSLNKLKEKEWKEIAKQEARAKGWKFKGWFAYKAVEDLYFEISFYSSGRDDSMHGSLQFKLLVIDEKFWEIVGLDDNKKMPLSFRGSGAFVVGSKDIYSYKLKVEPQSLKSDIDVIFDNANTKVDELVLSVNGIDSFAQYLTNNPSEENGEYDLDLLILSSIIQKNYDVALPLINKARKINGRARWGGFGELYDKDFYDMAIGYCRKNS